MRPNGSLQSLVAATLLLSSGASAKSGLLQNAGHETSLRRKLVTHPKIDGGSILGQSSLNNFFAAVVGCDAGEKSCAAAASPDPDRAAPPSSIAGARMAPTVLRPALVARMVKFAPAPALAATTTRSSAVPSACPRAPLAAPQAVIATATSSVRPRGASRRGP